MSSRATTLLCLTAAALAVAVAACSSSKKSPPPSLASGDYFYTASDATPDECWASTAVFPPVGIALPFTVTAALSSGDGAVMLTPHGTTTNFLPALSGFRVGNFVVTSGNDAVVLGSGCTLTLKASASGTVTGDDEADLAFTARISSDPPSNCSAFLDTSYHGIPFPTLTPATNGACTFGYTGILAH